VVRRFILVLALVAAACSPSAAPGTPGAAAPAATPGFSLGDTRQNAGMTVDKPLTFSGQADGDVDVMNGGVLTLNGQVTGDLIVETGGSADVLGMVIGAVVNNGGKVTIYGQAGSVLGLSTRLQART
jgi:hypothetical protein